MDDLSALSLTALQAALVARTVSAAAVAAHVVQRADTLKFLNAFITPPDLRLVMAAEAIDRADERGPLAGAPVAVKDNIDTADMPTTAGTPGLRNWRPVRDADVVARLRAAGGLVAGKANMHELAGGMTSANVTFGAVGNPYDPTSHGGGSSGGSAAAVAARIVPAALGTDTGGSVLIPAAMCGIWGFRPTVGRVSQRGVVPLAVTRDTVGWFARTPEDLCLLDRLHAAVPATVEPVSLDGLRLGVPRAFFQEELEPEVAEGFAEAQARLRQAGAVLVPADLPGLPDLAECGTPIVLHERTRELAVYLASHHSRLSIADVFAAADSRLGRGAIDRLAAGTDTTAEEYRRALTEDLPKLRRAYAAYFADNAVVAMMTPPAQLAAKPVGSNDTVVVNGFPQRTIVYARFSIPPTTAQLPGLSVPVALSPRGVPVGALFIGPALSDGRLLGLGESLGRIFPPLPAPAPART